MPLGVARRQRGQLARGAAGSSRSWARKGEERLFRISEQSSLASEEAQEIAESSKSRFFNRYEIRVFNDADLKLVMCVFIALSLLEHQSTCPTA
jgi:hypothetical protein